MASLHGPERILDTSMESFAAGFAVDGDELVATYAVGLFAKGLEEALRGATDEGITGLMSLEVIDLLQAVQVEIGDAQAAAILSGQGVTDLVVPVSVVQPGGKILHIHLGDDVVLLGDLPFLELDLLPEIAAGLLSHFFRKPAVARVHLTVRVGKVEMTRGFPGKSWPCITPGSTSAAKGRVRPGCGITSCRTGGTLWMLPRHRNASCG